MMKFISAFVLFLTISPVLGTTADFDEIPDTAKRIVFRNLPSRDAAHLGKMSRSFRANLESDPLWKRCKYLQIEHHNNIAFPICLERFENVAAQFRTRFEARFKQIENADERNSVCDASVILSQHPFFNWLLTTNFEPTNIDYGGINVKARLEALLLQTTKAIPHDRVPFCVAARRLLTKSTLKTEFHDGIYCSGPQAFMQQHALRSFQNFYNFMRELAQTPNYEPTFKATRLFLAESGPENPLSMLNTSTNLIKLIKAVNKLPPDQMQSICACAASVAKDNLRSVTFEGERTPGCSTFHTVGPEVVHVNHIIWIISQIPDLSVVPDIVEAAQTLMTEKRKRAQAFPLLFRAAFKMGPAEAKARITPDLSIIAEIDDVIDAYIIEQLELDMHPGFF